MVCVDKEIILRTKTSMIILSISLLFTPIVLANTTVQLTAEIEILEVIEDERITMSLLFKLKNDSEKSVKILKWGTPFEGEFTNDCFDVKWYGEKVPYIGKLVTRGTPEATDFIEIPANGELTEIVFLEDGYKIYKAGSYTIQYRHGSITSKMILTKQVNEAQEKEFSAGLTSVSSIETEFFLHQGLDELVPNDQLPKSSGCSATQIQAINMTFMKATQLASLASEALQLAPPAKRSQTVRYTEWFGNYAESRYSHVSQAYAKINNVLKNKTLTAYCPNDCSNYYAYVYPAFPDKIFFCGGFWKAPESGTRCKAGVVIHEVSHFNAVAGTDDIAYGKDGAKNLARNKPDKAVRNADNYAFFAENSPWLPILAGINRDESGADSDGGSGGCFIQLLTY